MKIFNEVKQRHLEFQTRRHFLKMCSTGLGSIAMGSLFGNTLPNLDLAKTGSLDFANMGSGKLPHFAPKAKRVIYLHMAGSPSQLELFDYKPELNRMHGEVCPASMMEGKKFAFISDLPTLLGHQAEFKQHGQSGTWISDRLPHFSSMADEITVLKAMHTDEFNHAPAQLLLFSGSPRLGRPSMGSWVTYGLGSENENLPGYVVLVSGGKAPSAGKSAWGSGFLPSVYQGVQCRSEGDPVLYVSDPKGMSRNLRKQSIEAINKINQKQFEEFQDPEILTRISQYEMAFKMQMSVPEAMDISKESKATHEMYGTEPGKTSFANNALLARRLVERGVRFIQLFHWGWDHHGNNKFSALHHGFKERCMEVDQAMTALLKDLKMRGLLEDTLVVWGGEFGRTPMQENRGGVQTSYAGRDHQTSAFSMWVAGGGIKPGMSFGETDAFGLDGIRDRVHVHDLQATILNQLGFNHEKLTHHFQGRDFRLTDVAGKVIRDIIA